MIKITIFTFLSLTLFLKSEIDIKTLSNWHISAFDEYSLLVTKKNHASSKQKGVLGFYVDKPYCFASQPIIMLRSHRNAFEENEEIYGQMIVDRKTTEKIKISHAFRFDHEEDDVNWFEINDHPKFSNTKRIHIKFNDDNRLKSTLFVTDGIDKASYQAMEICRSTRNFEDIHNTKTKV